MSRMRLLVLALARIVAAPATAHVATFVYGLE